MPPRQKVAPQLFLKEELIRGPLASTNVDLRDTRMPVVAVSSVAEDALASIDRLIDEDLRALVAARSKIDSAQREIDAAQQKIAAAQQDIDATEARLERRRQARTLIDDAAGKTAPTSPEKTGFRKGSLSAVVRSRAFEALREAGHPLNRVELLAIMRASGIEVEGADPAKRVGKIMWGGKEFQHVGEGYWISGEPVPEGVSTK